MSNRLKVIIADDEAVFRQVLVKELNAMSFEARSASSGDEVLKTLKEDECDVVLLDVRMPGLDGLSVLKSIKQDYPMTEVIMLTGFATIDSAISAIKLGAYDYLTKPCKLDELEAVVKKAAEKRALQRRNVILRQELTRRDRFDEFVGRSARMRELFEIIAKVAATDSTALILGESGAGKELAARAIHRRSARRDNPLIVVDCTSLQEELLQSELCGHERGAFTGAVALKHGLFEVADSGTLFLDEIGEMSFGLQSKLLRVLETGTFRRLGGVKDIHVDVRIIAATNRDLKEMVAKGAFREDLYYRLNVVTIQIPPLRDRRDDIRLLARHFVENSIVPGSKSCRISDAALDRLAEYDWPGNVRELKNVLERALILAEGESVEISDLPVSLQLPQRLGRTGGNSAQFPSLEQVEKDYIEKLLKEFGGNRARVAAVLQVSERNLYRKIKQYGL